MSRLMIKVGASVDSSIANTFTAIEKAAQRAGQVIQKNLGDASVAASRKAAAAATASAGPYRQTGQAATKAGHEAQTAMRAMGNLADGAAQKFKTLSAGLKRLPSDLNVVAREAQRALQAMERDKARAALGLPSSGSGRYWSGMGGNLSIRKPTLQTLDVDPIRGGARFGMSAASFVGRAAMGLARSAGVETDLGSIAAKNVNEQTVAQQIVNSGYMPGQRGPNGVLQSQGDILAETRKTSVDTATDRGELLAGLQAFVGKTGDLDLGRRSLADMAKLSRATGSNLADVANAAAEVSNVLGDIPDKAGVTNQIMEQIAGQGKLGAVEIRDLATQMAKLATQATKFKGGAAENIALLGVVAQEAKQRGGATNAAQATTAVTRFVEEFQKPTVLRHLKGANRLPFLAHDLNPYADAGNTQLKQAPDLIKEILSATHGDLTKLGAVMPSTIAQKAIGGFAQVYNQTSGSDADKIAAVTAEFERLHEAQLTDAEVSRAFAATMQNSEAASKKFNSQLAATVEQVQGSLLPALKTLAPAILDAAKAAAKLVTSEGAQKAAGAAQNVLSLFGFGDASNMREEETRAAFAKESEALNYRGTMRRWEETHLMTNAEGAANPQQELANAEQVLAPARDQEKELQAQIDPLAARIAKEKHVMSENAALFGMIPAGGELTDDRIKKMAADGSFEGADKYMSDKKTLEGLHDALQSIKTERENLVRLLSSGAVTVRLADSPNPKLDPSGTMP
jgi:hypothetical protein